MSERLTKPSCLSGIMLQSPLFTWCKLAEPRLSVFCLCSRTAVRQSIVLMFAECRIGVFIFEKGDSIWDKKAATPGIIWLQSSDRGLIWLIYMLLHKSSSGYWIGEIGCLVSPTKTANKKRIQLWGLGLYLPECKLLYPIMNEWNSFIPFIFIPFPPKWTPKAANKKSKQ